MAVDHLLMIGFGGPTSPQEIQPFLEEVTRGLHIPSSRLREVAHHYEAVGGRSPYNEYTLRLFEKLQAGLQARGITLPVFLGMRNWHPFLKDTLADIQRRRLTHGLGIVLAPHRSFASFEKYLNNVEDAKAHAGAAHIRYEYLQPWHSHPLFIEAQADQVRRTLTTLNPDDQRLAHLIFSAHSIPVEMAQRSQYAEEFRASSEAVAQALGRGSWSLAYQSRSGSPQQPWLEPDVGSAIRAAAGAGARQVVVVPVGFLCDNVEVLFDLDIEAKAEAERTGLRFARASTVMDHPTFVEMFTELIEAALRREAP